MFDLHEDASSKGISRLSILQLHVRLSTPRDTLSRSLDTLKAPHVKAIRNKTVPFPKFDGLELSCYLVLRYAVISEWWTCFTTAKKKPNREPRRRKGRNTRGGKGGDSKRSVERKLPDHLAENSLEMRRGLSNVGRADSESVEELLEEGNAFEAGAVIGVEDAERRG
jgi:hypothetical protein